MKTFILENIYMSDMSNPSVYSTDRFPTFESAMEEAHKKQRLIANPTELITSPLRNTIATSTSKVTISRIGGQLLRSRLPRRRTNEHTKLYRNPLRRRNHQIRLLPF